MIGKLKTLVRVARKANRNAVELARLRAAVDRLSDLGDAPEPGFLIAQQAAIERGVGPVLLATLPKSGSVYLWRALCGTLHAPSLQVAEPLLMMDEVLVEPKVALLSHGGAVAQHHLSPSRENIETLKRHGVSKLVVHLRDPRQGAVSWWHYGVKIGQIAAETLDDERREDFLWDNYVEPAIGWIHGWLKVPDLDILTTTHADLARDERKVVADICRFYGHDLPIILPEKSEKNHYRSGRNDEWSDFFSEAFRKRAAEIMPPDMVSRFGWVAP